MSDANPAGEAPPQPDAEPGEELGVEGARRVQRAAQEARKQFLQTATDVHATWQQLRQTRDAILSDQHLRRAALNLLEDTELARRREEEEAAGRERAEAAQRVSEIRYRALFESIDEGFKLIEVVFDASGQKAVDYRFLETNPAFIRQTGLAAAVGKTMRELAPEREEFWCETYGRVALTGEPVRFEHAAEALGRVFDVHAWRVGDPAERRVGVIFNDITERKQAEAQLAAEKEYAEKIVETLHEPLLVLHPDLTVRSVNPAFYTHFQVNPAETIGRKVYELGNGQWNIPALRTLLEDVLPDSKVFNDHEVTHDFESLGRRVMLVNGRRLDHVQLILLGIRDITDRKQAEEVLRATEEQFRRAIEDAPIPVIMHAEDGQVLQISHTWTELTGYTREDIPTFDAWLNRAYGPGADQVREHMHQLFAGHLRTLGADFEVITRSGERRACSFSASAPGTLRDGRRYIVGMALDVTDRKAVEEALRASEARLAATFEIMPLGLGLADAEGKLVLANKEMQRFLPTGTIPSRDERHDRWLAYDAEGHRLQRHEYAAARALRGERVVPGMEVLYTGDDGRQVWTSVAAVPVMDPEGRVSAVVLMVSDIDALKRATEAVRASEERLRTLADAVPQIIWTNDAEGTADYFNRRWYEFTGLTYEQSAGPGWQAVVHPDDALASTAAWQKALAAGEIFDREYRLRGADGAYRWFIGRNVPMRANGGQVTAWFGTATDIQDLKEAEAALRESQERVRLIVENAREYAIFSLDLDRRIASWNSGAQAILGYNGEEAIGQSGDIIFTAEDRADGAPEREAETALAEGRAADERWHVRKDESLFFGSGVMTAMHDAAGQAFGFVKIFRDQTDELRAKEALEQSLQETERARAEAEAAGRAKDHFLAVLSHELRTPLTPVIMAVRTLARRKDLPPPVAEALDMIQRNVQLEAHFVDDLLDLTRISRGKMELVHERLDLHEVVRHAVEVSRPDIEAKNQRLEVALSAERHALTGDAKRLQQVFWNLTKNAAKFTPEGGTIHVLSRNDADRIVVEVHDTGIGFPPEDADRIFDAFTQGSEEVTRQFGGLGLGLAITKATVLAHGGTISAWSPGPGQGAIFTVSLPAT